MGKTKGTESRNEWSLLADWRTFPPDSVNVSLTAAFGSTAVAKPIKNVHI